MELSVNVYGRSTDVTELVYRLLARFPLGTLAVDGDVSAVTTEIIPGGPLATINVSAAPFAGPVGAQQRQGLVNFLRDQLDGPEAEQARAIAPDVAVAVAIIVPDDALADPEAAEGLWETAHEVAGWADGFVLSMAHGEVRGPDGEMWGTLAHIRADDADDSEAAMPLGPPASDPPGAPAPSTGGTAAPSSLHDDIPASLIDAAAQAGDLGAGVVLVDLPDDLDPGTGPATEPPRLSRVVARMLVLVAISARCLTEEDGQHLEEAREGINTWCEELGIAGEIEEHERALLQAEPTTIDRKDLVNGSWGAEAAAVLAWALQLVDLPAHDVLVEPGAIYQAIGFPRAADTIEVLGRARLRSPDELAARREQLFALHWRLRQFGLDGAAIDLAEFARTAWFGPLDVDPAVLAPGGDLAVGGAALADADPNAVRLATSIALERHRAINWLHDGGRYSDTDVST